MSIFASPQLAISHLEAENLSEVVDAKSSLEADNGTAGGSVEVSVDSVQVNALGDHGDGLTDDLDNVVEAKSIGSISANTVNKADELGGQGGGLGKSTLDLENELFSFVYRGMSDQSASIYLLDDGAEQRDQLGLKENNVDNDALGDAAEQVANVTNEGAGGERGSEASADNGGKEKQRRG